MKHKSIALVVLLLSCLAAHAGELGIDDLTRACGEGDLVRVKKNVDGGVGVNDKDKEGWYPLCKAAAYGQTDVVKYLLKDRAKIDQETTTKNTPLIFAASRGHLETVKLLLKEGANTKVKNSKGDTAEAAAERHGHDKVASLIAAKSKK